MLLTRRVALRLLVAGAFTCMSRASGQKGKASVIPTPPSDEEVLEAYYATDAKYKADPVPAPVRRDAAIAFVHTKMKSAPPPGKLRKLMRLAVFYYLHETAAAFAKVLTGSETGESEIARAALCLVALAWIGGPEQQVSAQPYYHRLQDRADVERDRNIMLEVVEAFGPREGMAYHRQWIQGGLVALQNRLRQQEAEGNISGARLTQQKIAALTEYLNLELARVDRAFAIRERIEKTMPTARQIPLLVAYSLATAADSTPQLSFWASMKLLGFEAGSQGQIALEFLKASSAVPTSDPRAILIRQRALRAAAYFGQVLPEADHVWLATQPDSGTDPLALRPLYYKVTATAFSFGRDPET
jgi:hypothetical protein